MDFLILLNPLTTSALMVFCFVTLGFLVSIVIKRNDIADIMWGPGIALGSHTAVWMSTTYPSLLQTILLILISIWASRLSFRIARKKLRKTEEDPRYKRWRESWKYFYLRSYLQVFLLQGALMLVLAYPVIHTTYVSNTIHFVFLLIGVLLWLCGFIFETIGDAQLDRFLKDLKNKGQLMQSGLWKYCRHPNYFGEITMWWAIGLMTISLPLGTLTLMSPIIITLLIRYVSGVPLLEAAMERHPAWAAYTRKTSMLIPLFYKKQISIETKLHCLHSLEKRYFFQKY